MDYVETITAQKRNAGDQLGLTPVNTSSHTVNGVIVPTSNQFWPNLTGAFAQKLVDYWLSEADKVAGHVAKIPESSIRTSWQRQVNVLRALRPQVVKAEPHKLLPVSVAVLVWTTIDGVYLPLRGLAETATKWDLIVESVVEAVQEVGGGTKKLLAIVAGALVALVALKWS